MRILSLTKYDKLGASSRLRTFQYLSFLERQGVKISLQALIPDEALLLRYKLGYYPLTIVISFYVKRIKALLFKKSYDLIWIEKEALPWFPFWIEWLLIRGKPFILDYDDATFHNYDQNTNKILRFFFHNRLDRLMVKASLVICGNLYLKERAIAAGAENVVILPTVINLKNYPIKRYDYLSLKNKDSYQCRIVWIGSPSTQKYLKLINVALQALAKKHNFIFRVIGADDLYIPEVNIELCPWTEEKEAKLIRECDIGIMPLFNTSWEKGKCGYKLIQYMGSGLPVVASPIGINKEIVCHGENGFLANNEKEWIESLETLLTNSALRSKMGLHGRKTVAKNYSLSVSAPNLINKFRKLHNELTRKNNAN